MQTCQVLLNIEPRTAISWTTLDNSYNKYSGAASKFNLNLGQSEINEQACWYAEHIHDEEINEQVCRYAKLIND